MLRVMPSGAVSTSTVVSVTVTYQRTDLLRGTVEAIASQSRPPDHILVIDNGSMGRAALEGLEVANVRVVETGDNSGPAGGYARGFDEALALGAEWIWAVDDDDVPDATCLEVLLDATRAREGAIFSPLQRKPDGTTNHAPSWNGPLISADAVRRLGGPLAELFFWAEDTEFVHRCTDRGARKHRVDAAGILHLNPVARVRGDARDWRCYYEVRNTLAYRLRIRRRGLGKRADAWWIVLGIAGSIVLFEPEKRRSLRLWWLGVSDYRANRMGKRLDPATWERDLSNGGRP
jgi:rhamnopyranosyl-N-acetylglucosaminyl-diphospho-decaprenol beta-1,3/1,4-galactofuranosyltransferase